MPSFKLAKLLQQVKAKNISTAESDGDFDSDHTMFYSDIFSPLIADGKMYVFKTQLEQLFVARMERCPVEGLTYEKYIEDLKTISTRNSTVAKFLEEDYTYFIFECGNFERIVGNNVDETISLLKEFISVNEKIVNDLRSFCLTEVVYDRTNNTVKQIDLSSLWYKPFYEGEASIRDINVMYVFTSPTETVVYALAEPTDYIKEKAQLLSDRLVQNGFSVSIKYV